MGSFKGNVAKMLVRCALLRGEGSDEGADNLRGLAPNVLKRYWVVLLRHNARSRRHIVADLGQAKLIGCPDVKILSQPAQRHAQDRESRQNLGHIVPCRYSVDRVFDQAGKPGQACQHLAVKGEARRIEGTCSEGAAVDDLVGLPQAKVITLECLSDGMEVMPQRGWLSGLQVSVSGDDRVRMRFGQAQQRFPQSVQI